MIVKSSVLVNIGISIKLIRLNCPNAPNITWMEFGIFEVYYSNTIVEVINF